MEKDKPTIDTEPVVTAKVPTEVERPEEGSEDQSTGKPSNTPPPELKTETAPKQNVATAHERPEGSDES